MKSVKDFLGGYQKVQQSPCVIERYITDVELKAVLNMYTPTMAKHESYITSGHWGIIKTQCFTN